ncbi:MAG: hypothetical protein ACLFPS_09700 [Clostridia bacterium]
MDFGLPSEVTQSEIKEIQNRMANALEALASSEDVVDIWGTPGNNYLRAGDRQAGLLDFVLAADFINGTDLATSLGLTAGTAINSESPWIKYIYDNKICFTPVRPLRYNLSHDSIYEVGAVYGTGGIGTLPPEGRLGSELEITDATTITTTGNFQGDKTSGDNYYDTVGAAGDTIVLSGWDNSENNGEFTIDTISDTTITIVEGGLTAEVGDRTKKLWPKVNEVNQDAEVTIGSHTFKVRLMRGAANDPVNSYADSDRGSIGDDNEYNQIILPLHERAKLQDWNYPEFAGNTEYWKTDLSDEDFILHNDFGYGSYRWCQEVRDDDETFRRVLRGSYGSSYLGAYYSWNAKTLRGWAPVLELV